MTHSIQTFRNELENLQVYIVIIFGRLPTNQPTVTYQYCRYLRHYFELNFAQENIAQIIQHFYQALSYSFCLNLPETGMICKIYIFTTKLSF